MNRRTADRVVAAGYVLMKAAGVLLIASVLAELLIIR